MMRSYTFAAFLPLPYCLQSASFVKSLALNHDSRIFLHLLNCVPHLGPKSLRGFLRFFKTPEEIWRASETALRESGAGDRVIASLLETRSCLNIDQEQALLEKEHVRLLSESDENYPDLLKETHLPPFILYARGSLRFNSKPMIAIVGARHSSAYGTRVAETFAKDLSAAGIVVVSGLAFGIDSAAHKGTLQASGKTVAVLGNGLSDACIAPKSQQSLAQVILNQGGALLSEYPPNTLAAPHTFPARNRIIAGISLGTVIVEAAEKSGSLITAKWALEYNREVFAVPGSVFSEGSAGTHSLIRSGAKIVTGVRDILEELRPLITEKSPKNTPLPELSDEEAMILQLLSSDPTHIDKILKTTTLDTAQVQSSLVMLEVKGVAKDIGGLHYIRL